MADRLAGKVVLITGATSGIGEATARCFAAEGSKLLLAGRTADKGNALARELGANVLFQQADVMHEADIAALIDTAVNRFGRIDCLFSNAGAAVAGTLDTITEAQFNDGMKLLVGSVMFGMKHAARVMKPQGSGCIINNASVDVANAALYLASDEGSFVNCHDLVVDGGRIAQFYERPAAL